MGLVLEYKKAAALLGLVIGHILHFLTTANHHINQSITKMSASSSSAIRASSPNTWHSGSDPSDWFAPSIPRFDTRIKEKGYPTGLEVGFVWVNSFGS